MLSGDSFSVARNQPEQEASGERIARENAASGPKGEDPMEETESSWPRTRGPLFPGPGPGTPAAQRLLQTLTSLHLKRAIKQDTAHFQIQEGSAEKNLLISTATMANTLKMYFPLFHLSLRVKLGPWRVWMRGSLRNYRGKCPRSGLDRKGPGAPVMNRRSECLGSVLSSQIRVGWGGMGWGLLQAQRGLCRHN